MRWPSVAVVGLLAQAVVTATPACAQIPPTAAELASYTGLFAVAATGDAKAISGIIARGGDVAARDGNGRTPLHVAAFLSQRDAARALVAGGADPRALDRQRYDIITIAAVKDDVAMLQLAIELGADARAITSPYDGTALIAAAHLGHHEVVVRLIAAGAPLDHVNNLGWTALIESIVLGDGGRRHVACLEALLAAGANPNLADRQGSSPLRLAHARWYPAMIALIEKAGGR